MARIVMEFSPQNISNNSFKGQDFDAPMTLPEHLCIGKEMHSFIYELRRHGAHILKLLDKTSIDANVRKLLEDYILQYSKQSCKIAVVGQMKAGKSAFINALIGRRDFLPSDVNPWTTVVTRLHFGVPNQPYNGAKFKFFDEGEWNAIANGGGRLRELVQRFLPGFASEKLEEKLGQMRKQAEQRFGNRFYELLGKSQSYEQVQPELLEQYVCAGNAWSSGGSEIEAGHYSDITKSADLYFKSSPFLYPTTLIDTPGTNDPFFVRDEITYRNLDDADIFIVVLPAHKAFSMSDLALLRVLQGLNKDRIIIFINRIDQLGDLQNDTRDIVSHVRYMLQKEIPNINIPVILGSAHWGQKALALEGEHAVDLQSDLANGLLQKEDLFEEERVRSKLYFYSGIPEIASEISKMMLKGKGRNSVGTITSNLQLATESVRAIVRNQINSLKKSSTGRESGETLTEAELHVISYQLEYLQDYTTKSNYYHIQYEKKIKNLKEIVLDVLKKKLQKVVTDYAMLESQNLKSAMEHGKRGKVWRCDTLIIRKCLEEEYLLVSKDAINQVNSLQSSAGEELRQLLKDTLPDVDRSFIRVAPISDAESYVSAMVLKHNVALDLDQSWWKLWGSRQRKPEEWAHELKALVISEFRAIVEQLVRSADSELDQVIADSNRNFSAISKSIANILMERTYELQQKSDYLLQKERQNQGLSSGQEPDTVNYNKQVAHSMDLIKRSEVISQQLEQLSVKFELLCRGTKVHAENVR